VKSEVILSAGSVQSPQLLELSGIGNPEILKAAGIDVKVENPNVGENLQEHMCKK
jgi:choline dehydrogenase-like flavoprotein